MRGAWGGVVHLLMHLQGMTARTLIDSSQGSVGSGGIPQSGTPGMGGGRRSWRTRVNSSAVSSSGGDIEGSGWMSFEAVEGPASSLVTSSGSRALG